LFLFALPLDASAVWQIDQSAFNAFLCQQMRVAQACTAPALIGNYPSRAECELARTQRHLGTDMQWLNRSRCVERPDIGADRPRMPAPAASGAPRRDSDTYEAARFEQQRRELLVKLKGPADAQSPSTGGALRDLQCAAHWALAAAREAASGTPEAARGGAQRSADAQRARDCPPAPVGAIPMPTPSLDDPPPEAAVYRQIVEQAQAIRSRLLKNREALETARARRMRTEQALAQIKGAADAATREDADAQRRARDALAAVEQLERELAQLDAQLARSEKEQQALAGELQALERRFETAQARDTSVIPEVGRK
jgi:hypothetical protein